MKFVKINFLAGRVFLDDTDLQVQCTDWQDSDNRTRPSQAPNGDNVYVARHANWRHAHDVAQPWGAIRFCQSRCTAHVVADAEVHNRDLKLLKSVLETRQIA